MQRYFVSDINDNNFTLSMDDSYHITKVMRMKIDDLVEIVYNKNVYISKIISFNPVVVSIIEKKDEYNEIDKKVTICQSLVKESKMDLILEKSTELGAYSFIPLKTRNSVVKETANINKKIVRWQRIVKEAAEQSKRNIIPKVNEVIDIKELCKLEYDLKILLSVNEMSTTLKNVLQNHKNYDTIIIVIGPEGGFKSEEESYMISHGFISTSIGNLVLRTETASISTLSMINYEFER